MLVRASQFDFCRVPESLKTKSIECAEWRGSYSFRTCAERTEIDILSGTMKACYCVCVSRVLKSHRIYANSANCGYTCNVKRETTKMRS